MIRFKNIILCVGMILFLSNCTTNKTFTKIGEDIRQVDVFNQNKKLVKTYYQKFNSNVTEWLNVTCVFTNNKINRNKLENLDECKFTNLSMSIIHNKNKQTNQNSSKNETSDYDNSQNNNSNENDNNEGQSNNPGMLPQENHNQEFEKCNDPTKC